MLRRIRTLVSVLLCCILLITSLPMESFALEDENKSSTINIPVTSDGVTTFDCVWLGEYYQANGEKKEPIKWRVLSIANNTALLITDKTLDYVPFTDAQSTTWEGSTLQTWLNEVFMYEAFEYNVSAIAKHTETTDDVFVLSKNEIEQINLPNIAWGFDNTSFAESKYLEDTGRDNAFWWLRYPHTNGTLTGVVLEDGTIGGKAVNCNGFVRPCVYLKLDYTTVWSYAGTVGSDGSVSEQEYNDDKEIEVEFVSTYDGNIVLKEKAYYSDDFFSTSNQIYNLPLARVSLLATMASTSKESNRRTSYVHIKKMMEEELGFEGFNPQNYDVSLDSIEDKVAFSISYKEIDGEIVIAVVIRSSGYGGEWYSNGQVAGGIDDLKHKGFYNAAMNVESFVQNYVATEILKIPDDKVIDGKDYLNDVNPKVWISGFSRGAAVSNLLAKLVFSSIDEDNLYCYTFATPKTTQEPDDGSTYTRGVFNTINPIDLISEVPFEEWGYGYYGQILYLPSQLHKDYNALLKTAKTTFTEITEQDKITYAPYMNHRLFITELIRIINDYMGGTEDDYQYAFQETVSIALGSAMGGVGLSEYDGQNLFEILHSCGYKFLIDDFLRSVITYEYEDLLQLPENEMDIYEGLDYLISQGSNKVQAGIVFALLGPDGIQDLITNDKSIKETQLMVQHWPETYLAWLNTGTFYDSIAHKVVLVKCPVDVTIYDENQQIVMEIVDDNSIDFIQSNTVVAIEAYVDANGQKRIVIPGDGTYHVDIKAREDGKMNYSVEEYDSFGNPIRKVNYNDISIKQNDTFEGIIGEGANCDVESFDLTKNDTEVIPSTEVLTDKELGSIGIEVNIAGNGRVLGVGAYSSGDSVVLSAIPDEGWEFLGWYINDKQIENSLQYGFVAETDCVNKLEARFVKKEDIESDNTTHTCTWIKDKVMLPTCTEEGYTLYHCTCGKTYTSDKVKAIGHKFSNYIDDKNASCSKDGTATATCDHGCGKTYVKATTKNSHKTVVDKAVAPSCTADGKTAGTHCSVCNKVLQPQEVIEATGHNYSTTVTAPTCMAEGYTTYTCACGDSYIANKVEALGHTEETAIVKATTKKSGVISTTCIVCNEQLSTQTIARVSKTKLKSASVTYNGFKRKPNITVIDAEGNKLKNGRDYTVTYKNAKGIKIIKPKNVGKYQVVVNFKGNYNGAVKKTFKINPRDTKITKLTKNGKQFTVNLKKIKKQSSGYEVMYSTAKNFKNGKMTKTKAIKNRNTTTLKITKLKAKTKYYVKVRTYKTVKYARI